jgi:hypothetical protein
VAGEEENVIVLVQQVAHVGYRCERGRDGELREHEMSPAAPRRPRTTPTGSTSNSTAAVHCCSVRSGRTCTRCRLRGRTTAPGRDGRRRPVPDRRVQCDLERLPDVSTGAARLRRRDQRDEGRVLNRCRVGRTSRRIAPSSSGPIMAPDSWMRTWRPKLVLASTRRRRWTRWPSAISGTMLRVTRCCAHGPATSARIRCSSSG